MLMRFAITWSASLAIQYAPLAPDSRIQATTGLSTCLSACTISSLATALPPGLLISRSIACMFLSSLASSSHRVICVLLALCVLRNPLTDSVVMIPVTGMMATPFPFVGATLLIALARSIIMRSASPAAKKTYRLFIEEGRVLVLINVAGEFFFCLEGLFVYLVR